MNAPADVHYAGVLIGRAEVVRPVPDRPGCWFLVLAAPLPVGTTIEVGSTTQRQFARVTRSVESTDAADAGIEIQGIVQAEEVPADTGGVPEVVTFESSEPFESSSPTDTGDKKKKKKKR